MTTSTTTADTTGAVVPHRATEMIGLAEDLVVTTTTAGSGSPVLVLHGGAGPASTIELVEHLCATHRVLAPVHPGWEGTARPDRLDSVAALAQVHLDLLEHARARGVVVVASSFGGWVAVEMALRDEVGRIAALVLLDPVGPPPPSGATPPPPTAARSPRRAGPALLEPYTGPRPWDATLLTRAAGIGLPALVVWGEEDPVLPVTAGHQLAAALPQGTFTAVPGAGHLPFRDQPRTTFAAVDAFLLSRQGPDAPAGTAGEER